MDTSSAVKMDASGGSLRVDVVWSHVKAQPTPSSVLDPSVNILKSYDYVIANERYMNIRLLVYPTRTRLNILQMAGYFKVKLEIQVFIRHVA